MNSILIYSDDTKAHNNSFIITTIIWGNSRGCFDYEKSIRGIITNNKGILGKDFKGFHAKKLGEKNWPILSKPYLELINKLFDFVKSDYLRMLVYLESKEKYDSNSRFLEDVFKKYLLDRESPFGQIFKHINERDLVAIYKRAPNIYNYVAHREKFGGPNQIFEYYPDSSGKILDYKREIRSIESPGLLKGIPILSNYFEIIRLIADNLAKALNEPEIRSRLGWREKPQNQKLAKFEPKNDEDSYLVQSADVISNFCFHFIRYLIGIKDKNSEKKARVLLDSGMFDDCLDAIKENFKIQNELCVCSNTNLKASIIFEVT